MILHKCYVRYKPIRQRFQPNEIDITAKMPDIEKIKINAKTAVAAVLGMAATVFLAGGWFFGIRQMKEDMGDMKQILIKMADHDIRSDERILTLEHRVDNIENWDGIRSPRGLKPN